MANTRNTDKLRARFGRFQNKLKQTRERFRDHNARAFSLDYERFVSALKGRDTHDGDKPDEQPRSTQDPRKDR